MNLQNEFRTRLINATRAGNQIEKDILRLSIAEMDRVGAELTERQQDSVIRGLVTANKVTLGCNPPPELRAKLEAENAILEPYLFESWTKAHIVNALSAVEQKLKELPNAKAAIGIAFKTLKIQIPERIYVDGELVKEYIEEIRGETIDT